MIVFESESDEPGQSFAVLVGEMTESNTAPASTGRESGGAANAGPDLASSAVGGQADA